jgi:hypothetical protein
MIPFSEMSNEYDKTRYVVRAFWTKSARKQHAERGFHEG